MCKMIRPSMLFVAAVTLQMFKNAKSQFMPPMPYPPMPPMGQPMPIGQHMPMGQPMPMGPIPIGVHQPRLPVVVMPYRNKNHHKRKSRKRRHKRRHKIKYDSDDSSSSDTNSESGTGTSCSDEDYRRLGSRPGDMNGKRRRQVLTPVISYVTKDGYVIYQKKVRKDKAKDWLEIGKKPSTLAEDSLELQGSEEVILREFKDKLRKQKRAHKH